MSSHNQALEQLDQRLSHQGASLNREYHHQHHHQIVGSASGGVHVVQKISNCNDDTASLHEELRNYEQYLDDYNYCRKERLKRNAMDKYNLTLKSVRNKSKDRFPYELDDDEFKDACDKMIIYDIEGRSPTASSASSNSDTKLSHDFLTCYKKILKRHGRRLTSGN